MEGRSEDWRSMVAETSWWLLVVALTVFAVLAVGLGVVSLAAVLGLVELVQSVGETAAGG